jgi:hypothetical protein
MSVLAVFHRLGECSTGSHRKQCQVLIKQTASVNFETEFMQCVYLLLQAKKDQGVEKIFRFLSLFFTEVVKINDPKIKLFFSVTLFEKLLLGLHAGNKVVRFRSSQMIAILMNSSDEIK